MNKQIEISNLVLDELETGLQDLEAAKHDWAKTGVKRRIEILSEIKTALISVAEGWATTAAEKKLIPEGSPLAGEEWISGPYALISACNGLIETLSKIEGKSFLDDLPKRTLPNGQLVLKLTPHSIWDHLLLSGIKAEVWMKPEINRENLKENAAVIYDQPEGEREGKVALVLGAGNIASIAPLDAFQKLFIENQVVMLKMNPVNDYLTTYLKAALKPLIDEDALRIVKGDGVVGEHLVNHKLVEEIHITGAGATHDAIVWGTGKTGAKNKKNGKVLNPRKITSELGAVCPTIVVPGPWSAADIRFQAEQIATQKIHNSGFNCVACQTLIMPQEWEHGGKLLETLNSVMSEYGKRGQYYPGTDERLAKFTENAGNTQSVERGSFPDLVITEINDENQDWLCNNEIFAPALSVKHLQAKNSEAFLREAISFANESLYGTLGANIVIHPSTIREIGKEKFEEILTDLKYGAIAINTWTGLAFLLTVCPWGGYPNATLEDVGSGIGTVHNTFMLENTERAVVSAPWRPFPRGLLSGQFTMLPKPPWFVTNRRQEQVSKLFTHFEYKPSLLKLPRIFMNALIG
ncbi:MAG: aldehyde dehydrogenase family protein [Pseudomonadota bacterium]